VIGFGTAAMAAGFGDAVAAIDGADGTVAGGSIDDCPVDDLVDGSAGVAGLGVSWGFTSGARLVVVGGVGGTASDAGVLPNQPKMLTKQTNKTARKRLEKM
jgi:hypothetical protein